MSNIIFSLRVIPTKNEYKLEDTQQSPNVLILYKNNEPISNIYQIRVEDSERGEYSTFINVYLETADCEDYQNSIAVDTAIEFLKKHYV